MEISEKLCVGDVIEMRKPHPCGGTEWQIVRIGADIGLRCLTCNHRVLVPRSKIEKRIKTVVHNWSGSVQDP